MSLDNVSLLIISQGVHLRLEVASLQLKHQGIAEIVGVGSRQAQVTLSFPDVWIAKHSRLARILVIFLCVMNGSLGKAMLEKGIAFKAWVSRRQREKWQGER